MYNPFPAQIIYQDEGWRIVKNAGIMDEFTVESRDRDAMKEPYWKRHDHVYASNEYAQLNVPIHILMKLFKFWKEGHK